MAGSLDQVDDEEFQLDFSSWHREIPTEELRRKMRNPMRSQIKVQKMMNKKINQEETKGWDLLDSFTFDKSLGMEDNEDHDGAPMHNSSALFDQSYVSINKCDELIAELQELAE